MTMKQHESDLETHIRRDVLAIEECLKYLHEEASRLDLPLLAHLIDVAAECAAELNNFADQTLMNNRAYHTALRKRRLQ